MQLNCFIVRSLFTLLSFSLTSLILAESLDGSQQSDALVSTVIVAAMRDPQWMSYRDAYKAMEVFNAYQKPKNYLKPRFLLWPKNVDESTEGLRLQIIGETTNEEVELENLSASIPVNKAAFDEAADFRLNRKAGSYNFSRTITILENSTGIYSDMELRLACNQVLDFFKDNLMGKIRFIGKKCTGIRFVYPKKMADTIVSVTDINKKITQLTEQEIDIKIGKKSIIYRFSESYKDAEIVTETIPIAIIVLIE